MAQSDIRRSGADPSGKADGKLSGWTIDPGPYEATVVGHVENTRSGQLIVTIADWGGFVPDQNQGPNADQIVVSYASPFYGKTYGADSGGSADTPQTSGQSYGMWFVPPDVGNTVLVIFAGGQRDRGYWFACIYDGPNHHMVPGMARNLGGSALTKTPPAADGLNKYFSSDSVLPVVEVNIADPTALSPDGLDKSARYPHEFQSMCLVGQGLDRDPLRGAISSSSLRESPSNVYGISTPGRKASAGDFYAPNPELIFFRKGGHQFVMDDGSNDGTDQLIRLRTSSGHQILMNDTEKILYIASSTGKQWLEFSATGEINVFGGSGINMRSQGPMNFHSDSSITMNALNININGNMGIKLNSLNNISIAALREASVKAGGTLTLTGSGTVALQAGAAMKIGAIGKVNIDGSIVGLNCGAPPSIPVVIPPILHTHKDSKFNGTNWDGNGASVLSVCTVVPSHEPWVRPPKKK